jgi:hypothetical protein
MATTNENRRSRNLSKKPLQTQKPTLHPKRLRGFVFPAVPQQLLQRLVALATFEHSVSA